jgi:Zn-finger nucleic acid-binding protein
VTQAATLACPQCGASVPDNSVACSYCRAPLLMKACPKCLARVFLGHRFCPECGGGLAARTEPRPTRKCPRCAAVMVARELGDLVLDDCAGCGGTFVDRAALELLLEERAISRAESVLGAYDAGGDAPLPNPPGAFYVKCPDCATVMNRKQFAWGAKVIVDVCKAHGTWFDVHELPRIVRFVKSGGLDRAAQRALDEEREKIRQERDRLRAEANGGATGMAGDARVGIWSTATARRSDGATALLDLIRALL